MKPTPRRTAPKKSNPKLLPIDVELPPSPETLEFNFHIENKTSRDKKETKKRSQKKSKGPKKTR